MAEKSVKKRVLILLSAYNGEKYLPEQYTVTESQCSLSCEIGKVELGSLGEDEKEDVISKVMISSASDTGVFSGAVRFPLAYGEGGEIPVSPDGNDVSFDKNIQIVKMQKTHEA